MFCPKCGTEVSDDKAFCPECGNPLKSQAQQASEGQQTAGAQQSWQATGAQNGAQNGAAGAVSVRHGCFAGRI